MNRRQALTGVAAAGVATALGIPARATAASATTVGEFFPTTLTLPNGFRPEGIAIGAQPVAFFGSLADGSIYRANLVTGEGRIISTGPGTPSVGLKVDALGRLFVSGGPAGDARVVNTFTGEIVASYRFAAPPSFVNDVVLTPRAAYFTDSLNPFLYVLPFGRGGALPGPDSFTKLPLTGDLVYVPGFNANGIARTPDGLGLLVVQTNTGGLFRVNPATGLSSTVDLVSESLPNGDGLLLRGHTLYAVQNQLNTVAVVRLTTDGLAGRVQRRLIDPRFDVPTTVAAFGNRLYLPNARFTTTPTPTTPYTAVAITP